MERRFCTNVRQGDNVATTASFTAARNAILSRFKTTWDADTPAITSDSTIPQVFYEGLGSPGDRPNREHAEIFVLHQTGVQGSLMGDPSVGKRRFEKAGIVTVQVRAPRRPDLRLAQSLAEVAKKAFEGKTISGTDIWFQNVRINEVGIVDQDYQINILAEFRYDELV
jgi:hypothetical protein